MSATLYEADFYAWTQETAAQLQRGELGAIDMQALIEEVIDLGNRHKDAIESLLTVLFCHMLKWDYQPARQSRSWVLSIEASRAAIHRRLRKTPSLKPAVAELLPDAYAAAVFQAAEQTGLELKAFPDVCPYSQDEVFTRQFAL